MNERLHVMQQPESKEQDLFRTGESPTKSKFRVDAEAPANGNT